MHTSNQCLMDHGLGAWRKNSNGQLRMKKYIGERSLKCSGCKKVTRILDFFYAQTMKMRRRNAICGLEEEDGTWTTDRQRIQELVVQYFHSLFSTIRPTSFQEIISCVSSRVGRLDNDSLITLVAEAEIENAIFQMYPTKSPSPNGFNAGFFPTSLGDGGLCGFGYG